MTPKVLAHVEEATSSAMLEHMEEETERGVGHFMGDMMRFHWGNWSPVFIILWWLTWILIIIALIVLIRWFWVKGGKNGESKPKG